MINNNYYNLRKKNIRAVSTSTSSSSSSSSSMVRSRRRNCNRSNQKILLLSARVVVPVVVIVAFIVVIIDGLKQPSIIVKPVRVQKHLFRHYEDVSFDSWLRCCDPYDFLLSVGYTEEEIYNIESSCPKLLTENVHNTLAPKIRFLVEVLKGGTGRLNWKDEDAANDADFFFATNPKDDDEQCDMNIENDNIDESNIPHSMRVSDEAKKVVPNTFFTSRLDRHVGPKHAYLTYHDLPNGYELLENNGTLLKQFLQSCDKINDFVTLCQQWSKDDTIKQQHTIDTVNEFENEFGKGLIPAVQNRNNNKLIVILLQHGANCFESDINGVSPLHWAAGSGINVDTVRMLLQSIAETRSPSDVLLYERSPKDGATPLHWSCCGICPGLPIGYGGSYDICRMFLELSNDDRNIVANEATYTKNTPLMWAAWSGNVEIIDLLHVHGADPHNINSKGQNAAHWSTASGQLHVCKYLYETLNVNFTIPDELGNKPIDYAILYNRTDVIDWMKNTNFNSNNNKNNNVSSTSSTTTESSSTTTQQ